MRSAVLAVIVCLAAAVLPAQEAPPPSAAIAVSSRTELPDSPGALRFGLLENARGAAAIRLPAAPAANDTPAPAAGSTAPIVASNPSPEGIHWVAATGQTVAWLGIQSVANIAMNKWVRGEVIHGKWFKKWMHAVKRYRFDHWNDDDSFICDYIGHPIMGAVTNDFFIQNDPAGRALELEASGRYWKSRMKAMAWSAFWSAEWKVGPISEASIGDQGLYYYWDADSKVVTNGTGIVDFVVTPVVGTAWQVGEDAIDRYIVKPIEGRSTRPLVLFALSWLTPARSAANVLRFKAPWYRDSREVRAGKRPVRIAESSQP